MMYAVLWLSGFCLLLIVSLLGAAWKIGRLNEANKKAKALITDLQYRMQILQETEAIKHENRKEAQERLGGIDYGDVDTALSVLHDNTDEN